MTYVAERLLPDMESAYYDYIEPAVKKTDIYFDLLHASLRTIMKKLVPGRNVELQYGTASRFAQGQSVIRIIDGKYALDFPNVEVIYLRMLDWHSDSHHRTEGNIKHTSFDIRNSVEDSGRHLSYYESSTLAGPYGNIPITSLRNMWPYTRTGAGTTFPEDPEFRYYEDPAALTADFARSYSDRLIAGAELGSIITNVAKLEGQEVIVDPVLLASDAIQAWRAVEPDVVTAAWTPFFNTWLAANI